MEPILRPFIGSAKLRVPQRSIHGFILFITDIDDMPDSVISSVTFMFAGDLRYLNEINFLIRVCSPQNDLDSLYEWYVI